MLSAIFNIIHIATNAVLAGKSTVKASLVIAIALVFIVYRKFGSRLAPPRAKGKHIVDAFLILLASTYIFGIALSAYYYTSTGADGSDVLVTMSAESLSTTYYLHDHTTKSAFSPILAPFGKSIKNADVGIAYENAIPYWVQLALLADFIALVALAVASFLLFAGHEKRGWLQALLLLVLLASVKNAFDGGLLNYETAPALAVLWVLLKTDRPHARDGLLLVAKKWRSWAPPAIALVLGPIAMLACSAVGYADSLKTENQVEYGFFIAFIYFGWYMLASKTTTVRMGLAILCIGFWGVSQTLVMGLAQERHLATNIGGKMAYIGTYGDFGGGELVDRFNGLSVRKLQAEPKETIGSLTEAIGDNDNYSPITVEWLTCSGHSDPVLTTIVTNSKQAMSTPKTKHSIMNIVALREVPSPVADWRRYIITFSRDACAPRPLNVMHELIVEAGGLDTVTMQPIMQSTSIQGD